MTHPWDRPQDYSGGQYQPDPWDRQQDYSSGQYQADPWDQPPDYSRGQHQPDPTATQRSRHRLFRNPDKRTLAKNGGGVASAIIGGMLRSLVAKLVLGAALALIAYFGVAGAVHLPSWFNSHTTITSSAVMTKLAKIEQVHVATATYQVNVKITQSVGIIPCFLVCNQMQLQGNGTDDAIVNLSTLSPANVDVNAARSSVTLWIPPPAIGPPS